MLSPAQEKLNFGQKIERKAYPDKTLSTATFVRDETRTERNTPVNEQSIAKMSTTNKTITANRKLLPDPNTPVKQNHDTV